MIEPTQTDIGRSVIYRDFGGRGKIEEGVITSFNDHYVFVRYCGETSAATSREDLEWSHRRPEDLAVSTTIQGGKVVAMDFVPLPTRPGAYRALHHAVAEGCARKLYNIELRLEAALAS